MGQTIVEKILSSHSGTTCMAADICVARVDGAMASDTTGPMAIRSFEEMGGERLWDPERCYLVIDHAAPAPNERIANLHVMMRRFSEKYGARLFDAGKGICHQLLIEKSIARPGGIIIGADSHTCSYGAVGAMGVGVGSTDLAAVLITGKIWLKVPETIKIVVDSQLSPGVYSKDLMLHIVGKLGIAGATYCALEVSGDAISNLSLSSRIVMANMMVETGAKTGFISTEGLSELDTASSVFPDDDAEYTKVIHIDAAVIPPTVSSPHSPDNTGDIAGVIGTPVDYAFIGSCVNGRLEDLQVAAAILKDRKINTSVRLVIGPASESVFQAAVVDGTVETLLKAGAVFIPPGCGPCVGTHNGVPGDCETVISAANRNFKGRMGNPKARIYLASPAVVAVSALAGVITNPLEYPI